MVGKYVERLGFSGVTEWRNDRLKNYVNGNEYIYTRGVGLDANEVNLIDIFGP